jgi:hypothetical protein
LWINHRWGRYEPTLKGKNLFLAHCYNEDCLAVPGRVQRLYSLVFSDFLHEAPDLVLSGKVKHEGPIQAQWPGHMILVNDLAPGHPVRRYLEEERHYNADLLAQVYDVRYCLEPEPAYRMARQRIIIPITVNGILQGWQARYVGTPPSKDIPKYLSMAGLKRNQLLYNFDNARKHPYVVVMEGPTDVWSFGSEAVALFGKSASSTQLDLIARHWQQVYICLDGDALNDAQGIYDALGSRVKEKVLVTLPPKLDPGALPTSALRDMVLHGSGVRTTWGSGR